MKNKLLCAWPEDVLKSQVLSPGQLAEDINKTLDCIEAVGEVSIRICVVLNDYGIFADRMSPLYKDNAIATKSLYAIYRETLPAASFLVEQKPDRELCDWRNNFIRDTMPKLRAAAAGLSQNS